MFFYCEHGVHRPTVTTDAAIKGQCTNNSFIHSFLITLFCNSFFCCERLYTVFRKNHPVLFCCI